MSSLDLLARNRIVKEINQNFLVEASAGSGKTTSLVDRMVALVESGVDISSIVAITFTKKAANEFYERFYKRLYERSRADYTKKEHDLLDAPTDITRNHDKKALKDIDLCFLGTIDAFCYRVLKEHPFDADIPSSSNIVTEKEDLIPYIDNELDELRKKDNEQLDLIETLLSKDDIYQLIFYSLEHREYKFNFQDSNSIEFKEKLNLISALLNDIKSIIQFISNIDEKHITSNKSLEIYKYIKYEFTRLNKIAANDYKEINGLKWLHLKDFSYSDKKGEVKIPSNLSKYFVLPDPSKKNAKTVRMSEDELNKFFDAFQYFIYVKSLEFIEFIRPIIYETLKENGKLQFIDNLIYLNNLLASPNLGPTALKEIRKKYKYYLIDEFQDTSPLQIELFFRLSSDIYKKNWMEIIPNKGSLFMVGDPKQSIYRFKAADFETYSKVKNMIIANKEIGEVILLMNNFRSCSSLINYFNNTFSSYLVEVEDMQAKFESIPTDISKIDNNLSGLYLYKENDHKLDYLVIANLVKKIKDENPNIRYSDFMIIPDSKDKVGYYKEALTKLSIPSFSEGKIKYQGKLFDAVIKLFRFVLNKNEVNAIDVLTSVLNINLNNLINKDNLVDLVIRNIPLPVVSSSSLPSMILENLISNKYLISHFGNEGLDLLIFILNILKDEENKGNVISYLDAINLVDRLINNGDKERVALLTNDLDVIRIANVHKVKGLQAKIVILASSKSKVDTPRDPNFYVNHKDNLETIFKIPKEFNINIIANNEKYVDKLKELESKYASEEKKRLMYVAATRAENTLIICNNNKTYWKDLINNSNHKEFKDVEDNLVESFNNNAKAIDASSLTDVPLINETNKNLNDSTYNQKLPSDEKNQSFKEIEDDEKIIKNRNDSKLIGTLIHKLIECIVKCKNHELDINKCNEIVEEYQASEYLDLLKNVYKTIYSGGYKQVNGFKDDILNEIKTCECYSEVPFSYKEDKDIIYGYIDLLLINKDNKYIIIDYKTDKNLNKDHSHQLEAYKNALKKSLGIDSDAYIYNIIVN